MNRHQLLSHRVLAWYGLFAFAGSLLLWNLGGARTLSFHESLVATGAKEMAATGDWLVPRIAGEPWLEKPPLPQWLVALVGKLSGSFDAFYARLPAVLCGLIGVWLMADLMRVKRGWSWGILTGLVQASMVYFVTYSRLAEADIFLWLMVLACFRILAAHWVHPLEPLRWHNSRMMFFFLIGLTQLTKGPLFGAVLVLAPCVAYLLSRRMESLKWLWCAPGIGLAFVLGLAWPIAILGIYPEAAELWRTHTWGRFQQQTTINPEPFTYYLFTIPWQLLPWSIILLPALPGSIRRAWNESASLDRLLWIWFLVPLVLLSVPSGKHHHYLIHALPPFSTWTAQGLYRWRRILEGIGRRPLVLGALVLGLGLIAFLVRIPLLKYFGPEISGSLLLMAGMVGVLLLVLMGVACMRRMRWFVLTLFAGVWLGSLILHSYWLPWTDNYREETHLMRRFMELTPAGTPVAVMGMNPSRALFYTDRETCQLETIEDLYHLLDAKKSCYLLTFSMWEKHLHTAAPTTALEVSAPSGYNRWVKRPPLGIYHLKRP